MLPPRDELGHHRGHKAAGDGNHHVLPPLDRWSDRGLDPRLHLQGCPQRLRRDRQQARREIRKYEKEPARSGLFLSFPLSNLESDLIDVSGVAPDVINAEGGLLGGEGVDIRPKAIFPLGGDLRIRLGGSDVVTPSHLEGRIHMGIRPRVDDMVIEVGDGDLIIRPDRLDVLEATILFAELDILLRAEFAGVAPDGNEGPIPRRGSGILPRVHEREIRIGQGQRLRGRILA